MGLQKIVNSLKYGGLAKEFLEFNHKIFEISGLIGSFLIDPGNNHGMIIPEETDSISKNKNFAEKLYYMTQKLSEESGQIYTSLKEGTKDEIATNIGVVMGPLAFDDSGYDSFTFYHGLFEQLSKTFEDSSFEIIGSPIKTMILSHMANRQAVFLDKARQEPFENFGSAIVEEFNYWAKGVQAVSEIDFKGLFDEYVNLLSKAAKQVDVNVEHKRPVPKLVGFKPQEPEKLEKGDFFGKMKLNRTSLAKVINKQKDWSTIAKPFADYIYKHRFLLEHPYLMIISTQSGPTIMSANPLSYEIPQNVVGIDEQKNEISKNIDLLLEGKGAGNMILEGPPNTGKMTSLLNVLDEKWASGLKILYSNPSNLMFIPELVSNFGAKDGSYLIVVDKIQLVEGEDSDYAPGQFESMAESVSNALPQNSIVAFLRDIDSNNGLGFGGGNDNYSNLKKMFNVGMKVNFSSPSVENQEAYLLNLAKEKDPAYEKKVGVLNSKYDEFKKTISSGSINYVHVKQFARTLPTKADNFN